MLRQLCLLLVVCLASGRQGVGPGEQDWGYVDVRPGAHMFYWLYYTTASTDYTTRPLVIWLQGGPGASGTGYGNFEELGIVDVNLNERASSWVHQVNVLFIDNPVGTGFSYVDELSLLTTNNAKIATDLITFTKAFLDIYPEFKQVPLYIFSESYGGKMAAEFALELDRAIKAGTVTVPLQGVALGDSWISPIDSVLTWAPFLLQTGIVDYEGYASIDAAAQQCKSLVDSGSWSEATDQWEQTKTEVFRQTDNVDFYNILKKMPSSGKKVTMRRMDKASNGALYDLMNGYVRDTLEIAHIWDIQGRSVFNALNSDFMKPATDIVELLLNETSLSVVVFTGQLDLIVDTPGTLDWVQRLKWSGADGWRNAVRNSMVVNGFIEGYYKKNRNFSFYWIDRSGHMVPTDNPDAGLWLLKDVTKYQ